MIRICPDAVLHFTLASLFLIIAWLDLYPLFPCMVTVALLSIVYCVVFAIKKRSVARFFLYFAHMTAVWTLFGLIQSMFNFYKLNSFNHQEPYSLPGLEWNLICLALSLTLIYTGFLSLITSSKLVRRQEDKIYRLYKKVFTERTHKLIEASTFVNLGFTILLCALVGSGSLGFRAAILDVAAGSTLSWWTPLKDLSLTTIPFSAPIAFLHKPNAKIHKLVSILAIVTAAYVCFVSGRRSLIYFCVSLLYSYLIFIPKISNVMSRLNVKNIFQLLLVFVFVKELTTIFQYIRNLNYVIDINPLSIIELVSQYYNDPKIAISTALQIQENLVGRPVVLTSLAELLKKNEINLILFQDLFSSFLYSLPGGIVPFKKDLVVSKIFITDALGFAMDHNINMPTFAFLSFGFLGLIVYPVVQITVYLFNLLILRFSFLISKSRWLILLYGGFLVNLSTKGLPEGQSTEIFRPLVTLTAISLFPIFLSCFGILKRTSVKLL